MKVYTEIIINMNTNKIISEESYNYDGPVDKCCGSDPDYSDQYASLSDQKAKLAARKGEVNKYFREG